MSAQNTQKKNPTQPRPDPKRSAEWAQVVEETRESAERSPEKYLKETRVPAGGE